MKSLDDVQSLLREFETRFGLPIVGAQQGSEAWFNLKLGVISASNASRAVAGKTTETRAKYMAELVAQVATGISEEISAAALDWGKQHEDAARSSYEFANDRVVQQVSFIFKDNTFRVGCSPDGLVDVNRGAEIKCPYNSANFVLFLAENKLKSEWDWQTQFQMWVTGADFWDVVQYDPRMKSKVLHTVSVERDEKRIKQLEETIPEFIIDMDKMLAKVGFSYGAQWDRLAAKSADAV